MFSICLGVLLAVVWVGLITWLMIDDHEDIFFSGIIGFIGLLVIALIVLAVSTVTGAVSGAQRYHPYSWDVIAANDNSATTGRFGLFSGYIDSEFRYYYYYKDSSGGIRMNWVPADQTQIFEDAPAGTGSIHTDNPDSYWNEWGYVDADDPKYEIHIPEGSVVQKYTMDLQ